MILKLKVNTDVVHQCFSTFFVLEPPKFNVKFQGPSLNRNHLLFLLNYILNLHSIFQTNKLLKCKENN